MKVAFTVVLQAHVWIASVALAAGPAGWATAVIGVCTAIAVYIIAEGIAVGQRYS